MITENSFMIILEVCLAEVAQLESQELKVNEEYQVLTENLVKWVLKVNMKLVKSYDKI